MSGHPTAERAALSTNLAGADRMPACPRCHDLSEPGADVCESCGARLLLTSDGLREVRRIVKRLRRPKAAPERRGL